MESHARLAGDLPDLLPGPAVPDKSVQTHVAEYTCVEASFMKQNYVDVCMEFMQRCCLHVME